MRSSRINEQVIVKSIKHVRLKKIESGGEVCMNKFFGVVSLFLK